MKVNEVAHNSPARIVAQYTNHFKLSPQLPSAVQQLMSDDRFVYTGPMYRTIFMPSTVFHSVTPQQLINQTLQHESTVSAWSKTVEGMSHAVGHEMDSGNVEHNGSITLYRNGKGLDINAVLPNREEFFTREEELLCLNAQDFKIVGFGVGGSINKYTPAQYTEFLVELTDTDSE